MIRPCTPADFQAICDVINDAARAYQGVIPDDVWREPYMPAAELQEEIAAGVAFSAYEDRGELLGVMGIQQVAEVALIRHAYVRSSRRNQGIGGALLSHLQRSARRPLLIGTWADAGWAVRFYQRRGFSLVTPEMKDRLLRRYWSVPERQVELSVVLADRPWLESASG